MARQERKKEKKREPERRDDQSSALPVAERGKRIKEDAEKLLDEIDEVLEENAEEFVRNYIQKGGE